MSILDKEILDRFYDEICDGEVDILVDIATDCVNETKSLAKQIHTAFTAKDWELLNRSAHSMKSTSQTLGGIELSKLAERMEHDSTYYNNSSFDPNCLVDSVSGLNQYVNAFVQELRNEVAKTGGTI